MTFTSVLVHHSFGVTFSYPRHSPFFLFGEERNKKVVCVFGLQCQVSTLGEGVLQCKTGLVALQLKWTVHFAVALLHI